MLLAKERQLVVDYGKKLVNLGLTKGTGGNISIFDRQQGLMAISPSGMDYFSVGPGDVAVISLSEGRQIEGNYKPSSEYAMHRIFYDRREDINAVVHTHSTYATTLATMGKGLPASNYLVALAGPDIRCAPYRSFGTEDLAEIAYEYMKDRYCVLLANHGLLAGSKNIADTFNIALIMEECCQTYYLASLAGGANILSSEEMKEMMARFKTYGQIKK